MALFKSQIVTQASGSVGGLTFTRAKGGLVMRGRAMPVNPQSEYQVAVRNAMAMLSTRWVEVVAPEYHWQWEAYGKAVAMKNKLGDQIYLSGISHYIRNNVPRVQAGLAIVDSPPDWNELGTPPKITAAEYLWDSVSQEGTYSLTLEVNSVQATARMLVYLSQPQNRTVNFFKGPYRLAGDYGMASASVDIATPLNLLPGKKVFYRATATYTDGRLSPAVEGVIEVIEP